MKKNTKKFIIITIGCIFIFIALLSVFSSPYRTERIKLFINDSFSNITNRN